MASSLPSRGPPGLWAKVYAAVEKFMPWRYTGIFSHPEFKDHVPVVGAWRHAPTNPPFRPIVPSIDSEHVLEVKNFKKDMSRDKILADREISADTLVNMKAWQKDTPLGTARFRWSKSRQFIYDYEDNGYR